MKKAETKKIAGTFTLHQTKVIESLVGIIGSSGQDVVAKIAIMWLHQQGLLKNNKIERYK